MTRGSALVASIAAVVKLTGVQGLSSLEDAGELTVADLLKSASDIVYDRLEGDGIDPTALTNQTAYEQTVAWEFCSILGESGYLPQAEGDEDGLSRYRARAERHYKLVRPKTSDADMGRRANEAVPGLANFERGWAYGGGADPRRDGYTTGRPIRRD